MSEPTENIQLENFRSFIAKNYKELYTSKDPERKKVGIMLFNAILFETEEAWRKFLKGINNLSNKTPDELQLFAETRAAFREILKITENDPLKKKAFFGALGPAIDSEKIEHYISNANQLIVEKPLTASYVYISPSVLKEASLKNELPLLLVKLHEKLKQNQTHDTAEQNALSALERFLKNPNLSTINHLNTNLRFLSGKSVLEANLFERAQEITQYFLDAPKTKVGEQSDLVSQALINMGFAIRQAATAIRKSETREMLKKADQYYQTLFQPKSLEKNQMSTKPTHLSPSTKLTSNKEETIITTRHYIQKIEQYVEDHITQWHDLAAKKEIIPTDLRPLMTAKEALKEKIMHNGLKNIDQSSEFKDFNTISAAYYLKLQEEKNNVHENKIDSKMRSNQDNTLQHAETHTHNKGQSQRQRQPIKGQIQGPSEDTDQGPKPKKLF